MYERGDGVDANPQIAIQWYEQAEKQHYPQAITRLGWLAENGKYLKKDIFQAALWYEKAAKLGYAEAQFNLAALRDEQGDYRTAAQWYEKAAMQNHDKSLYNLAALYQDGKGVPQNSQKAQDLLKRAAKLGLPEAESALEQF